MSLTLQELKNVSAGLPSSERAELAQFLLQSLDPEEDGWTEAWEEELSRRLTEIRSGQVTGVPAEEVIQRLRERYP